MRSKVKHPILEGINFKNRESLFGITDSVLELTTTTKFRIRIIRFI
jgi:hypothetical protein